MALLILGIILWWGAHLFKRLAPAQRASLGDKGKGLVALLLVLSVVLMVLGYRGMDYIHVWASMPFMVHINNTLMLFALYFTSPGPKKGALFYKMRHPMLTGFKIWAVAHLLVNGDLASVILFGSMLAWAVVEVITINKSEPNWQPNPKGSIAKDAMFFVASIVLLGVIGYIHGLIGPSPFPG
ncbi:NnrU family protein [Tritonibacter mobilis]|uniref:NnrU family protein n=1 Tax=Tritonibacter mobilis TaxID=379347 RepID=UPI000806D0BA|nr:NnrU family protein [Tritonibacter mobilis]